MAQKALEMNAKVFLGKHLRVDGAANPKVRNTAIRIEHEHVVKLFVVILTQHMSFRITIESAPSLWAISLLMHMRRISGPSSRIVAILKTCELYVTQKRMWERDSPTFNLWWVNEIGNRLDIQNSKYGMKRKQLTILFFFFFF